MTHVSEELGDTVNSTALITGITWLKGANVDVMVDGVYKGVVQVSALGALTLPVVAEKNFSFGYMATNNVQIKTLPHASAGEQGPNWGRLKRLDRVFGYFVETLGGLVGDGVRTPTEIPFNDQTALVHGQTPPIFTGFKKLDYDWESTEDGRVEITTNKPYPMTLLSIGYELSSHE